MAGKVKKASTKYKATDPVRFSEMYNNNFPEYKSLSDGKSVSLNKNNKQVKDWLNNNIIVKE
ncbi:MAG: hypothetical protein Unbinned4139contig1000_18 [Prokaryotic dsDNA virus sp.]|nr:MAG: hypothetical protein Unbinned4139contig1000_18 [Prokaryotic dsDNA virus sp.]|tara:strand:+ start:15006 stop:15191 length:186 start_codon:yes stop_codon:yes gene_type:complete